MQRTGGNGWDTNNNVSRNATAARAAGAVPCSGITSAWVEEHGIAHSAAAIRDLIKAGVVTTREYHHTSKYHNATDFYRPEDVRAQLDELTNEQISAVRKALRERERAAQSVDEVHEDCRVQWTEHPPTHERRDGTVDYVPVLRSARGARVHVRGLIATITTKEGEVVVKRVTSEGFSFESAAQYAKRVAEERRPQTTAAVLSPTAIRSRLGAVLRKRKMEFCSVEDSARSDASWEPISFDRAAKLLSRIGTGAHKVITELEEGAEVVRIGAVMVKVTPITL